MKIIYGIITSALMISPSFAATLSSVECSSSEIVLTFDGNVSADDVTTLKIGEGSSPRWLDRRINWRLAKSIV